MTTTALTTSTTPSEVWVVNGRKQRMIPDETTGELLPYQRVSTFAGLLEDKEGLIPWKAWCVLKGEPHLPGVAEQARHSPTTPRGLIDQLAEAGGSKDAASKGSDRHQILAMALTGAALPDLPDLARGELDDILDLVRSLGEVVAVEAATVNDEYRVAGSCDLVLRDPQGGTIVCEFKTGRLVNTLSASVQLASHARARYWDPEHGRGEWVSPFRPRLVVIHAPQNGQPPNAVELDPEHAKEWADLAVRVREARKIAGRK